VIIIFQASVLRIRIFTGVAIMIRIQQPTMLTGQAGKDRKPCSF